MLKKDKYSPKNICSLSILNFFSPYFENNLNLIHSNMYTEMHIITEHAIG